MVKKLQVIWQQELIFMNHLIAMPISAKDSAAINLVGFLACCAWKIEI